MKLSRKKLIIVCIITVIISIITFFIGLFFYFTSPVSSKYEEKDITIPQGSSYSDIAHILKDENIIKSEKFFKLYLKLKGVNNIYANAYYLSPNMNLNKVINTLKEGGHNPGEVTITFKEGINARGIATLISKNTNNSYEDVIKKMNDTQYLDEVINKYWFISNDIKNNNIYYSLEGYLFPDTYRFTNKDSSVEEIFNKMLDEMDNELSKYKDKIEESKFSIHEILTLASITQSEGYNETDFKNIASVFYNRLEFGMSLGSCVTSYYGAKKDMTEELSQAEINQNNPYNTRSGSLSGLPVGPISNPGDKAIDAVINPVTTDYYYFVSDLNNKLYFNESFSGHEQTITKLKDEGLWLEW